MSVTTPHDNDQAPNGRPLTAKQAAAVLKPVPDLLSAGRKPLAAHLARVTDPGDTLRPSIVTEDGERVVIGTIIHSLPEPKVAVTDDKAFAEWLAEHYPAHVT